MYSPVTLVTLLADWGTHHEGISSSTKPDLMVRMLDLLDVQDGHNVLEIGTGTGYNAALLAHRLGDDRVFSIDIDAELVDPARERLASVGLHPTLVTRDGSEGLPQHAPYDRIIATCSVPAVPIAWCDQVADGGLLLTDIKIGTGAGNLVLLRRDGDRLEGHFTERWAAFMLMRHEYDRPRGLRSPTEAGSHTRRTTTSPNPWQSGSECDLIRTPSPPRPGRSPRLTAPMLSSCSIPHRAARGRSLNPGRHHFGKRSSGRNGHGSTRASLTGHDSE